jgi:hypothetical protein
MRRINIEKNSAANGGNAGNKRADSADNANNSDCWRRLACPTSPPVGHHPIIVQASSFAKASAGHVVGQVEVTGVTRALPRSRTLPAFPAFLGDHPGLLETEISATAALRRPDNHMIV